jgi:PAT family beta-lactamase induction signal transducer AmpG
MRLPDSLASRNGRLAAFFALYMTEGIPLGFTATAIATQMRRQGLGPAEIGWTCSRPTASGAAACGS